MFEPSNSSLLSCLFSIVYSRKRFLELSEFENQDTRD
jgi:hypothetical protein